MSTEAVNIVIQGQNQAAGALRSAAQAMNNLSKSTKGAATAMKSLVAVQVGAILAKGFSTATTAISAYVSELRNTVDRTAKLANQTGIGVEALQGFAVAASLGGTDLETFANNVKRLTVRVGRLAESGKTEIFEKLNIDFQKFRTLAPEDQFRILSQSINNIKDPAEKARVAVELFGKAGAEMLPMLNTNFDDLQKRLVNLGVILSSTQTSAIEEMNDALNLVQQTFKGIISQVTANLAPIVTSMANEFMGFVEGFQGIAGATGGNALADAITNAFFDIAEDLAGLFDYVLSGFGDFSSTMQGIVAGFQMVADVFTVIVETLKFAFNTFQLAGNSITEALGYALEGIGSWISDSMESFGRDMRESAAQNRQQLVASMQQNIARRTQAGLDAIMGRQGGGPTGTGVASQAVAAARERFGNVRGVDPEAEARKQRERELSVLQMQREAEMKRRAKELGDALKEAADAQKTLTSLVEQRDQMEAERTARLLARTPENQAVLDRFSSRGPQLDAQQQTAESTKKLAELNEKILAAQATIQKAAEMTARNTANMFGLVTV